ncbi:hypothetical protein, partial [Sulfitobacter sp. HI0076]|uniref:hypothetical protein n=1 Tax=Sulfitobacter sp. HI0076 TaxID=1822251 RepID=UPI001F16F2D5
KSVSISFVSAGVPEGGLEFGVPGVGSVMKSPILMHGLSPAWQVAWPEQQMSEDQLARISKVSRIKTYPCATKPPMAARGAILIAGKPLRKT